jgi:heme-degrading monooxygenase HmoA
MAAVILARFKVTDYDKWRQVFESKADLRKSHGCLGTHIFYNAKDHNDIVVNLQWDTEENATKFQTSSEAKAAMQEAGVIGVPDYVIVEDGARTPR